VDDGIFEWVAVSDVSSLLGFVIKFVLLRNKFFAKPISGFFIPGAPGLFMFDPFGVWSDV
jgi:hypothetical protein